MSKFLPLLLTITMAISSCGNEGTSHESILPSAQSSPTPLKIIDSAPEFIRAFNIYVVSDLPTPDEIIFEINNYLKVQGSTGQIGIGRDSDGAAVCSIEIITSKDGEVLTSVTTAQGTMYYMEAYGERAMYVPNLERVRKGTETTILQPNTTYAVDKNEIDFVVNACSSFDMEVQEIRYSLDPEA